MLLDELAGGRARAKSGRPSGHQPQEGGKLFPYFPLQFPHNWAVTQFHQLSSVIHGDEVFLATRSLAQPSFAHIIANLPGLVRRTEKGRVHRLVINLEQ
jgi:hypothetical protein